MASVVLKELHPSLKEFGHIPTQQKMIDRGVFSLNIHVTLFDSWKKIPEITEYAIINQKNHGI